MAITDLCNTLQRESILTLMPSIWHGKSVCICIQEKKYIIQIQNFSTFPIKLNTANLDTWPGLRSVARVGAEVPEPQQPTILQTFVDRYSHFVIVFAFVFVGGWIFNLFPPEPGVAKLVKSLLQECVVEEIPVNNKSGQSLKISNTLFQDKKLE